MVVLFSIVGALTLAVAVLDIYHELRKWEAHPKADRIVIVIKIVCYASIFALTSWLYYLDQDEKTRLSRTGRFIINTDGLYVKTPSLKFGQGANLTTDTNHVTFDTRYNHLFSLRTVKGKYNIVSYIREKDGDAIASINGTQFKIYHDGYDFNYDDKGFEIVTGDLKVVFQVDYDSGSLWLCGLFYDENGMALWIPQWAEKIEFYAPNSNFVAPASGISKIFKYPREEYFGEREN